MTRVLLLLEKDLSRPGPLFGSIPYSEGVVGGGKGDAGVVLPKLPPKLGEGLARAYNIP